MSGWPRAAGRGRHAPERGAIARTFREARCEIRTRDRSLTGISGHRVRQNGSGSVFGCGGVGLNVIQGAKIAAARHVIAVDVVPDRLDAARRLGATHVVDAAAEDAVAAIRALTGGVDCAFEAIGRIETIEAAVAATGRCGEVIVVGAAPPGALAAVEMHIVVDLYATGRIDLHSQITFCTLEEINDVLAAVAAGEPTRFVIVHADR